MRRTTTADSSRSARYFGKIRPRETASSSWPARPTRCSPRATDFGLSTWMTRSTAPMSMPSSSDEVATRHGISPRFSSSSISTRCSRAIEPWWARAISSSASSFSRSASRSASRRLLTNTIVERCSRTSFEQLRVDRRPDRLRVPLGARVHLLAVGRHRVRELRRRRQLAHVLDGHDDLEVELLRAAGVDELDRPAARDEAADLLERALRRRQADPLERLLHELLEPLDGERQVRAALRPGDRVHLVEDQRVGRPSASRAPAR